MEKVTFQQVADDTIDFVTVFYQIFASEVGMNAANSRRFSEIRNDLKNKQNLGMGQLGVLF